MSEVPLSSRRIAVIKIGGSVLTGTKAYRRAAILVRNRHRASPKERLVIVVSAQEGATDALELAARRIAREPSATALDLLWSTGELRSVALLTLHLQTLGVRAVALNIHEAGLIVPENGRNAAPGSIHLDPTHLRDVLADNPVAVVPGFFATDLAHRVVSLGRGGSDLTAVLLAKGLNACRCELIKDVPGYFTSDPHRSSNALPMPRLTFEQALDLADNGCDLVQRKAIEAASQNSLPIVVRSLDERAPLTHIATEETETIWADSSSTAAAAP